MGPMAGGGRYVKGVTLGKGTFGVVYKATDTKTGETVAIKKIHLGDVREGVNVTALREIKLLREMRHENVICLVDVFPQKRNLNLVFEFMDTDLEAVIKDPTLALTPADIKAYMQMTLQALAYCHNKWVLHRDMKPNNLLIASSGVLKLGDFGLARIFGSPDARLTHQVFARWYRAPELLFGSRAYGPGVDIWGAACVFAELLLRRPFLPGNSDLDQLSKIFAVFGTPQESQWPDLTCLPDYVEFYPSPPQPLKAIFPKASDDALDLLAKMFAFDPNRRISAKQALEHRYFVLGPPPTAPKALPRPAPRPEMGPGVPEPQGPPSWDDDAGVEVPAARGGAAAPGTRSSGETQCTAGRTPSEGSARSVAPMSVDTTAAPKQHTALNSLPPPRKALNSSGLKPLKRKLDEMFDPS